MTSGSPSSAARLQKSITARTAWLWATLAALVNLPIREAPVALPGPAKA